MKIRSLLTVILSVVFMLTHFQVLAADQDKNKKEKPLIIAKVDDAKIMNNVKSKLRSDPALNGAKIDVTSKDGVVSLSGNVKTDEEASKAVEHANSVEGVNDVDTSKLVVPASTQPFADTVITAKVKGAFIREKLFGKEPIEVTTITVETTDGVVYLAGTAESAVVIKNAENLAKAVSGVKRVESKVQIKAAEHQNDKKDMNHDTANEKNNKPKH